MTDLKKLRKRSKKNWKRNQKAKDKAGREFANGDFGCNRKLPFIQKIMKKLQEEKEIEM